MEFLKYGVGWILALAAIIAGAYYFFYNKRRKKLEMDVFSSSLLTSSVRGRDDIEIAVGGQPISDPYVLKFAISNVGHKDVSSKDFDANKSVKLTFGVELVSPLRPTVNDEGDTEESGRLRIDGQNLLVTPGKIAMGATHQIRILVDGEPTPRVVENPLLDTDLLIGLHQRRRELRFAKRLSTITGFLIGIAITLAVPLSIFREQLGVQFQDAGFLPDIVVGPAWAVAVFWLSVSAAAATITLLIFGQVHYARLSKRLQRARQAFS